ncbi:putative Ig domain-containing protein [Ensifer adhaerens]|uniref:putative Ig domain-containing protein n=1 Tax=Ensifer adhaerens TaxID=106592 RepID=UPI0023A94044|nr:putative Ig domain-containing protein [Ensifer adhaerens]WDZ76880.1 putative Ig domain-containing protein [Ensifer adhaerens]
MLKALSIAVILSASSASAGEIVWRSPTTGTIAVISDSAPTQPEPEPEEPVLGVHYAPIRVAAGSVVKVSPVGDVGGYVFNSKDRLPVGLMLDTSTGKIIGVAAQRGNYSVTIKATKDGEYSDLVLSITIS